MMFLICMILAGLLQITVLKDLNLLIILAVFLGLRKGPIAGLFAGAGVGMFASIISGTVFGLDMAIYGLVGFTSGIVKSFLYYKENVFMEFMFSFCGVFLFYFLYFIFTKRIPASIFAMALFSAIASPFIFRIVEK